MNNLYNPQLTKQVIIGTKSKSRIDLFKSLGLDFKYKSPNIDEKSVANLNNDKFDAIKIATAKARSLSPINKDKIIVLNEGSHGFKIIEKCILIEIKQGPFNSKIDKQRFNSVNENQIKIR